MAHSIYRKLTGRARRLEGYSQLWLAPDHLLLLRSTRFHEHYWRFALADIQAIVVTELPSRVPLQFLLAVCSAGWMLLALTVGWLFFKGFFLATGAVWLLFVIVDIARGPRCRCYLHTAVSRELLTPVNRMRTAQAVLAKLQPAIEAVQGSIPVEQLSQLEDRASPASMSDTAAPPEIVNKPGYLPEVVFLVLLLNAALILTGSLAPKSQAMGILLTTLPGELLLAIVALLRGSRDIRRYVYIMIAVALLGMGWDIVEFFRIFVHWFQAAVEAGQRGRPAPVEMFTQPMFSRNHAFLAAAWRIAGALIGLAIATFERKRATESRAIPIAVPETQ